MEDKNSNRAQKKSTVPFTKKSNCLCVCRGCVCVQKLLVSAVTPLVSFCFLFFSSYFFLFRFTLRTFLKRLLSLLFSFKMRKKNSHPKLALNGAYLEKIKFRLLLCLISEISSWESKFNSSSFLVISKWMENILIWQLGKVRGKKRRSEYF